MTQQTFEINISPEHSGKRLDAILTDQAPIHSRSEAQRLIKEGYVQINHSPVNRTSQKVRTGDQLTYLIPEPTALEIKPEEGNLDILFEDQSCIVVNKPAGMVVHPAPGHPDGTLVHFLMHHCQDLSGIGGTIRPGIVHRIDKDTSGILVVAKTDSAHLSLSAQFKEHSIHRQYKALVWGQLKKSRGTIEGPIGRHPKDRKRMAIVEGGKPAITHWKRLKVYRHCSLVECTLETGRTHQIRVHMNSLNHSLVGDPLYGQSRLNQIRDFPPEVRSLFQNFKRQALHAQFLGFIHPTTGEKIEFFVDLPEDFQQLLTGLESLEASP